jgi:hypothetical protein
MADDTKAQIEADQIASSPDFDDFVLGASDLDPTSIGGYPVRLIEVVAGTGTLRMTTRNSAGAYRTCGSLVAGSKIGPARIWNVAGTGNGTAPSGAGFTLRVYK